MRTTSSQRFLERELVGGAARNSDGGVPRTTPGHGVGAEPDDLGIGAAERAHVVEQSLLRARPTPDRDGSLARADLVVRRHFGRRYRTSRLAGSRSGAMRAHGRSARTYARPCRADGTLRERIPSVRTTRRKRMVGTIPAKRQVVAQRVAQAGSSRTSLRRVRAPRRVPDLLRSEGASCDRQERSRSTRRRERVAPHGTCRWRLARLGRRRHGALGSS